MCCVYIRVSAYIVMKIFNKIEYRYFTLFRTISIKYLIILWHNDTGISISRIILYNTNYFNVYIVIEKINQNEYGDTDAPDVEDDADVPSLFSIDERIGRITDHFQFGPL